MQKKRVQVRVFVSASNSKSNNQILGAGLQDLYRKKDSEEELGSKRGLSLCSPVSQRSRGRAVNGR